MKITVAHHIFASVKGYRTQFRCPTVTDSENIELESFSFGQTNDVDYMASLSDHPAFTVRKLRSGRWAITRVFQGPDDEYGRATLLFHTALFSQTDWIDRLGCDVQPILEHPALWQDTDLTEISVERDDSTLPQTIEKQVRSLLGKVTASASPVIVDEAACSLQTVRWVHRLLLDEEKESFSYGYRVLSNAMDASLLCLAHQAIRTSTLSRGQGPTAVSARTIQAGKRGNQYDYEEHTGSNKVAILIIIAVCVLGISGAFFALVAITNAQKEGMISEIKQDSESFLNQNKQFVVDFQTRKQKLEEAASLLDKAQKLQLKFSDSELEPTIKKLNEYKSEMAQAGELYDELSDKNKNLNGSFEKEQLQSLSVYPIKSKTKSVVDIKEDFEEISNTLKSDEIKSLKFFVDIVQYLGPKMNRSVKKIDRWKDEIQKLIIADPNAVEATEAILKETDSSQYMSVDPNQINFDNPNSPNWIDPNTSKWFNPARFGNIADEGLSKLKQMPNIRDMINDNSLQNAKQSHVPAHVKIAEEHEGKLKCLQNSTNQHIKAIGELKRKADAIKKIEDRLIPKQNELGSFETALREYDKKISSELNNPEKVWIKHLKSKILNFYTDNMESTLSDTYGPNTIKGQLYKAIDGSSLKEEKVFDSFYKYYENLIKTEEQQKQRESKQGNQRKRRQ